MKSLIATGLCLFSQSHATLEETSLMQGLVARRGQMAPDAKDARKDSTMKLMETATKMMKNGVTPDVITFINTTITEVNEEVLGAIIDEHNRDQQLIYDLLARFDAAVAAMEACAASIREQHQHRVDLSDGHKMCRSAESLACARSRRCEEELEERWRRVVIEEEEMRRIHYHIHDEWCVGPAPPHPSLADPFQWTLSHHWEGDETSQSIHEYPIIDLEPNVIEFRRFSVEYFGYYIIQLPRVEEVWELYWAKLTECAALEETWELQVEECDELQTELRDAACMHAGTNRQCAADFGHEYEMTMIAYNDAVTTIRQLEYDRKREWETLHIVTCLLRTVYTHVIHSIDSGEPCPTTESHPEQTTAEIDYCHVVEHNLTVHLDIDYGNPPPPPDLPPPVPPPCTAEYIWQEHGSFSVTLQSSHSAQIVAEGLEEYFTLISAFGWAGCAAPKACIPCEVDDLVVDPNYQECTTCLAHHAHLNAGQMDWDTFKCLTGNQCIRASGRCNEVANCDDGSDEIGCDNHWGIPSILQAEECNDPFVSDLQFRCADNMCTPMAGKCNGVNNCADGSDEVGCATSPHGTTIEAMTGYTATFETPELHSHVFYDREYTFDSLGSFTGHSYIKMSNADKHIRGTHIQMKLRLPRPLTIYVVKLDTTELPWLAAEGWAHTHLEGVSYHGVRPTPHTDWSGILNEDYYGPGQVYQKTFAAGTVELQGNNGGDGSYLMFAAHPDNAPQPPTDPGLPGADTYIGCFTDDASRDLGEMVGVWTNSATNTYDLCRAECESRGNRYMSLQWGGECFCADAYATADQYHQVDDSECDVVREPCSPNSHNCGGTWRQAIYQLEVAPAIVDTVADQEAWCAVQCQAQGYCCNDPSIGSNQQISCAQACMMRASGQYTDNMLSANGGICDRNGGSGCSLSVMGQGYSFCSSCNDLQPHCPHGVQSSSECDFGASLVPPAVRAGLVNGDFEGFTTTNYEYTHEVAGWAASGGVVAIRTNNDAWGGIVARSGNYLVGLQSNGASIEQTVYCVVGRRYRVRVSSAQRSNSPGGNHASLRVTANGEMLMDEIEPSTSFGIHASWDVGFTADSSSVLLRFENSVASGDQTVFVDAIEVVEA